MTNRPETPQRKHFVIVTALVVLVTMYGSLYPFKLRDSLPEGGAVRFLLGTWNEPPNGRGDFLANILLYMPYGFFAALAASSANATWRRLPLVVFGGAVLCVSIELTQFYDEGRVTSMLDVYANVTGSVLGAVGGILIGRTLKWAFVRQIAANLFPFLLLASWFGYRFYPYIPTIDLHKYWHAVMPLIYAHTLSVVDLFRFVVVWTFMGYLSEALFGQSVWRRVYLLMAGLEIVGKIFILDSILKLEDVIGLASGFLLWRALRRRSRRAAIMAAAVTALVVVQRLEPFQFSATPRDFGWIPFLSFMRGSIAIDTQSFLEKFFYYGGATWILVEAGVALAGATTLVAIILLVTSIFEIYLPDRSAELTDAMMAVAIAVTYRAIRKRSHHSPDYLRQHSMALADIGSRSIDGEIAPALK